MHVLWWEHRRQACIIFGATTLLVVLPVAIDSVIRFAPTTREQFEQAQRILVEFRLPHHAIVGRWFDWIAGLQVAGIAVGLIALRRSRLFPVLLIAFLGGVSLTALQIVTGSNTLALLFPWRISVLLVPVATVALLARAI